MNGFSEARAEESLRHWLALSRAPGVGPVTFRALLDEVGEPSRLFGRGSLPELRLREETRRYLRSPDWSAVDEDLAWAAEGSQRHILTLHDLAYPALLRQLPDAPPLLFVVGDPEVLSLPQLAVVGSRNPSRSGRDTAVDFARHLASAGLTITSGLAVGIDAAAHRGALAAADGLTVGVLGTGPDRIYPAGHRSLAHEIVERGALVTELPPGTPAKAEHFPRRNRLISGLSLGVLVVEAARHSGSLITARLAVEQGREVFAIPGSIHNPMARGCHQLIRSGAKLVETAADILEELGTLFEASGNLEPAAGEEPREAPKDPDYQRLLDALGHDPASVDQLVARSGLTAEVVSSMLLLLELQGIIVPEPGGRYVRATRV